MRTTAAPRAKYALAATYLLVTALVVTLLPLAPAAAAAAVPVTPTLPTAIEALAAYQGAQLCDPVARKGPKKLKALLTATYGSTAFGITRACSGSTATSEHMEGRALDWMISGKAEKANAKAFIAWLSADDAAGNHYAMARRMGLMYIVWDNEMFRFYDTARGWAEYNGCYARTSSSYDNTCHRNHVHFSFSWDGAAAQTSYWSGSAVVAPNCPSAPSVGAAPAVPATGLELVPLAPSRILDTAASVGVTARCRLSQDAWTGDDRRIDLQVTGRGGVPASGATAAILSIQVKDPNAPTKVYVQPTGGSGSRLRASTTGIAVDGLGQVTVPLGYGGRISFTLSTGAADLTVDVLGYYKSADGSGQSFHPTDPARLLSTAKQGAPLAPGESRTIDVAGLAGVPADGAHAVSLSVTAYNGTTTGGVTVYNPDDAAPPSGQESVAAPTGVRLTNGVVTRMSSSGELVVRNSASGSRDVFVDVLGWWAPASVSGGSLYVPLAAKEVIDTTQAKGVPGPMGTAAATVTLAGKGGVPATGVTAVALQATVLAPTDDTGLVAWRAGATKASVRSASPTEGLDHTVQVLAPLAAGRVALQNLSGTVGLRAYAVGYWYQP